MELFEIHNYYGHRRLAIMKAILTGIMTSILKIPYSMLLPFYKRTAFHRAVIDEVADEELKKAFSHCREITRHFAKTFYLATRFLPNEKQRGIFAIYGLCRYLDNLVDDFEDLSSNTNIDLNEVEERLSYWKSCLEKTYSGHTCSDLILTAFGDILNRYHIPIEYPLLLMDGVKMDLVKDRYQTFEEVYDYSYKVASIVGLMTSEVFGYKDESAIPHAVDLGIAMQLTNILRDIGEDLERGRIYLPQEELKQFGVTEEDLFSKRITPEFKELMKFQIERARSYYDSADLGIPMLEKDSQLPVYLARYNYSRILDKIEDNNYDVFDQRAYLNSTEKLLILPRVLYEIKTAS